MRPYSRIIGRALAPSILTALAVAPTTAVADLRGAPTPVTEAGCDVAVELDGPIARVTETHRLVPTGAALALAGYDAALAPGAVVDAFTVTIAGREEAGVVVPVESLDNQTPPSLGLTPDLGVLRVRDDDRNRRPIVDVRVYPVTPGKVTGFTLRWSAPLAYGDGRMTLILPARGSGDNLSRCRVRLDVRPGAGVRSWTAVRAAGVWVGAGPRVRGAVTGVAPDADLLIEAQPQWAGTAPVLAAAHVEVGGRVLSTIGIYVPDHRVRGRFAPRRLLFVIDTSRSIGDEGRRAALALVDTLVRAAPAGTPVEAVLFDRQPRRALGAWAAGDGGGSSRLARALRDAPMASGTDLASALRLASDVLGDQPAHVVVITDGVLPVEHDGAALVGHFPVATDRITVDVIVPLVGGAAAPDRGALETLTATFHGRVLAMPADRPLPAAALTAELATGLPIEALSITDGDAVLELDDLPEEIAAGTGVIVTAELERQPRPLTLHAARGEAAIKATAIALPAGAGRLGTRGFHLDADRFQLDLARTHHLVGPQVAVVVIDRRAAGGTARHDLARRTGLYTFTAPPEELAALPSAPPVPVTRAAIRRLGELPRDSVNRALRDQLVPALRVCYRAGLRGAPQPAGELVVELEIARGEVMAVNLSGDHFPAGMIDCVADAAYALSTPTYELGGFPDTVYVIRKPVTFEPPATAADEPSVFLDDVLYPATHPEARPVVEVDADAPL